MKKFILSAVAVSFMFLGTSCKKNYTCECTTSDSVNGTTTTSSFVINDTKKNAEEGCNVQATTLAGPASSSVSCSIQ
jgi:hypothetical protein